jgi:hypothetical protein
MEVSFSRIFIVGHNVIACINPLVLAISTAEEYNVRKLVGSIKVLELCELIKLSVPEESNFKGSILENWELLSDGVIGSNGDGVLGLGSKFFAKLSFERLKSMVKVERSLNSRYSMVTKG